MSTHGEAAPARGAPLPDQVANGPSRLRERTPLGRSVTILTLAGAALGGTLSSLAYAYWTRTTAPEMLVGSISAAILGGFFGFLASSFCKIGLRAWHQALEDKPPSSPTRAAAGPRTPAERVASPASLVPHVPPPVLR